MLIDSHVNLHGEAYSEDLEDVILRARKAGVKGLICICDKYENADAVRALADNDQNIWATAGIHPHYADDHEKVTLEALLEKLTPHEIVGVGECGLDFHYGYSGAEAQKKIFQIHIEAALQTGKPLVVHSREADDLMADMLEEGAKKGPLKILMHCYTSGEDLCHRALDLGAYFSMSGIATFKNAYEVRKVLELVPNDRLILETDCPYLAPPPHRGKRNEPAFLTHIATYFADTRGLGYEAACQLTTENCERFFGIKLS